MPYNVTFDIADSKSNVLGCNALLDEFTTAEFGTGTLTDVEAVGNALKLILPIIYTKIDNIYVTSSSASSSSVSDLTLSMVGSGSPRMVNSYGNFGSLTEIAVKAKVESFSLETDEWCGFGAIFIDSSDAHHFMGMHSRGSSTLYAYSFAKTWDYTSSSGWSSAYSTPGSQSAPMWIAIRLTSGGIVDFYDSPDGATWTKRQSFSAQFTPANLTYFGLGLHTGWGVESDDEFEVVFSNITYGDTEGLS